MLELVARDEASGFGADAPWAAAPQEDGRRGRGVALSRARKPKAASSEGDEGTAQEEDGVARAAREDAAGHGRHSLRIKDAVLAGTRALEAGSSGVVAPHVTIEDVLVDPTRGRSSTFDAHPRQSASRAGKSCVRRRRRPIRRPTRCRVAAVRRQGRVSKPSPLIHVLTGCPRRGGGRRREVHLVGITEARDRAVPSFRHADGQQVEHRRPLRLERSRCARCSTGAGASLEGVRHQNQTDVCPVRRRACGAGRARGTEFEAARTRGDDGSWAVARRRRGETVCDPPRMRAA